jgi:hypothetical protein
MLRRSGKYTVSKRYDSIVVLSSDLSEVDKSLSFQAFMRRSGSYTHIIGVLLQQTLLPLSA